MAGGRIGLYECTETPKSRIGLDTDSLLKIFASLSCGQNSLYKA